MIFLPNNTDTNTNFTTVGKVFMWHRKSHGHVIHAMVITKLLGQPLNVMILYGRIIWKNWLPHFTQKLCVLQENQQKSWWFLRAKWPKPHERSEAGKIWVRIYTYHAWIPCNNLFFDHTYQWIWNVYSFFVLISNYLPLLQEGTTASPHFVYYS